jgi:hypothetical protein
MSYSSESVLAFGTRIADVRDFVQLLGFKPWERALVSDEVGRIESFYWHDEVDYRSWGGVELHIYKDRENQVIVETRSTAGRSYFDLQHQNLAISTLRRTFGGTFRTDEGKGRYMRAEGEPLPAPASGCFLAFSRFGGNLIKASVYLRSRDFPNHPLHVHKDDPMPDYNPRVLANNMLVPFLVAASEEYFKSTWVAITRYSANRKAIFKNFRLQGNQLLTVADGLRSIEEQIAETLSFQKLSSVCNNFKLVDAKLDINGALRRPYRRRAVSLFESIERMVESRHDLIHRAILDVTLTEDRIQDLIYDLEAAVERVYRCITDHYGWFFEKSWGLGRRLPRRRAKRLLLPHKLKE